MTILKPVYTRTDINEVVSMYDTLKKVLPATAKVEICDLGGLYSVIGSNEVLMFVDKITKQYEAKKEALKKSGMPVQVVS